MKKIYKHETISWIILIIIIITSLSYYGCGKVEKTPKHKWVVQVKYTDNTLDTLSDTSYGLPVISKDNQLVLGWSYILATNVKRIKVLSDTLINE